MHKEQDRETNLAKWSMLRKETNLVMGQSHKGLTCSKAKSIHLAALTIPLAYAAVDEKKASNVRGVTQI